MLSDKGRLHHIRKSWTLALSIAVLAGSALCGALTTSALAQASDTSASSALIAASAAGASSAPADTSDAASSSAPAQSAATGISGTPEVIDADILKFGTQRVILWGIDAPESKQTCQLNGELWGCYDVAFRYLQLLAGRGEVTCTYKGTPDPFNRQYGVCTSGGEDLNADMVKAGMALAFDQQSDDYDAQMADAITAGVGLWQQGVEFEEPWVFRRRVSPGGYR